MGNLNIIFENTITSIAESKNGTIEIRLKENWAFGILIMWTE